MNDRVISWAVLLFYVLIGIAVAVFARKRLGTGMNEFFLANRQLGGFIAAMTYAATTYSAFMMVGLAGLTYTLGVGALVLFLQFTGYKPLGLWPGVWGLLVCVLLFMGVSFITRAPEKKRRFLWII